MLKRIRNRSVGIALTILACVLPIRQSGAASSQDAVITVTPVVEVSITLSQGAYDFGAIDVNTSTNSATAVTLTNTGNVTVAVDKHIEAQSVPAGWTAGAATGMNTYVLYCATGTARLSLPEFGSATKFGLEGAPSPLTGPTGVQPLLPPTGAGQSVDLWFRLDMPTLITQTGGRQMTVRFTAAAQ